MRLVMIFEIGDRYTWSSIEVRPINALSPEDAIIEFENAIEVHKANDKPWLEAFKVFNQNFWVETFYEDGVYTSPEFLTLDEWFERENR